MSPCDDDGRRVSLRQSRNVEKAGINWIVSDPAGLTRLSRVETSDTTQSNPWISGIFPVTKGTAKFPEFPERKQPSHRSLCSIWLSLQNFREFRLSGSLFGNTNSFLDFLETFPSYFRSNCPLFDTCWSFFLLNGKRTRVVFHLHGEIGSSKF